MAATFEIATNAMYIRFADNENSSANAASNEIVADLSLVADVLARYRDTVEPQGFDAYFCWQLGAATGSPSTAWGLMYQDDNGIWLPLPGGKSFTVVASDQDDFGVIIPAGTKKIKLYCADGGALGGTDYHASSTIYLAEKIVASGADVAETELV